MAGEQKNETIITLSPEPPENAPGILQVVPSLITGGVERGTIDIGIAARQAGFRSFVVSAGGVLVRQLERSGVTHIEAPVNSKNIFTLRSNINILSDLIQKHHIDIVHARSRAPAWSARSAARKTGAAFLTTFHGVYNHGNPLKKAYNKIMTQGEKVIAISNYVRDHMIKNYRTDPDRIRVIHRGIDTDIFNPGAVTAERVIHLATKWRLPDGVPIIMLPGRLTRWKGHLFLLKALAQLKDHKFRCLLVGSDQGRAHYHTEIQKTAHRLGLESHIHIVGDCNDMAAAYKLSDVVVSASTDPEAFGRVAVEAHALGRPVVAPDHGAAPEQIIPGETGWLYKPKNPDDLADALKKALSLTESERDILHEKAITNVAKNFTKDAMCTKTTSLYKEIIDSRLA